MGALLVSLWLTLLLALCPAEELPQNLLCVEPTCTGVISSGTTRITYYGSKPGVLSFGPNTKVKVLAKPEDPKNNYWGVRLNGAFGFAPKEYIREQTVYHRPKVPVGVEEFYKLTSIHNYVDNAEPKHVDRPTEELNVTESQDVVSTSPPPDTNADDINVSQRQTVIDGTTLYLPSDDSTTELPVVKDRKDKSKPVLDVEQHPEHEQFTADQNTQRESRRSRKHREYSGDGLNQEIPINFEPELNERRPEQIQDLPKKIEEQSDPIQLDTAIPVDVKNTNELLPPVEFQPIPIPQEQEVKIEKPALESEEPPIVQQLEVKTEPIIENIIVENKEEVIESQKLPETESHDPIIPKSEPESNIPANVVPEIEEKVPIVPVNDFVIEDKNSTELNELDVEDDEEESAEIDADDDQDDEIDEPELSESISETQPHVEITTEYQPPSYSYDNIETTTEVIKSSPEIQADVILETTTPVVESTEINQPDSEVKPESGSMFNFLHHDRHPDVYPEATAPPPQSNEFTDSPEIDQPISDVKVEGESMFNFFHDRRPEATTPEPQSNESDGNYSDSDVTIESETSSETITDEYEIESDQPGMLSKLKDFVGSLSDMFKPKTDESEQIEANNRFASIFTEPKQCSLEDYERSKVPSNTIFWLIISAVSSLLFTLGYYFLENRKQDGKLLALVNTLQKEMLCSSKENILLKDELSVTKEKLAGIEDSSFGSNEMVACLKKEIAESEMTIADLKDKLIDTEEELANSTEAALELQSILDEQLSSKDVNNSSLAFTITKLQAQLDEQQADISTTKGQLSLKIEENELLKLKIFELTKKYNSLESDSKTIREQLNQITADNNIKSRQIEEQTVYLEKCLMQADDLKKSEIKVFQGQLTACKDELNKVKSLLKGRSQEVQTLQESIKMLQLDDKNINAILDVSSTKADLVQAVSEKTLLTEKLESEHKLIAELNDKINNQNAQFVEMKTKLHESEEKALESSTRLEVLTNYFNQKEADLLKELSTKESLWMSQQGEAMSTVEKIESIQNEVAQYKEMSENMKRELAEQEAAWRTRVAALEQRAHEEWLARRAAERTAEASKKEAQTLRQRLAAPSPDAKRVTSPLTTSETMPDGTFFPPLSALGPMLPPPSHLPFLPPPPLMLPPPLPPLPTHRPPPLGRLSSPPPLTSMRQDRAYSPDSRYSPERAYSPQHRGRSPFSNSESRRRGYRRYDDRYYDSEEERRSRRYETETDFSPVNTLPPSPIPNARNHKGVSSGSGQSSESLERYK